VIRQIEGFYTCDETCDFDFCKECFKLEQRKEEGHKETYATYGQMMCERQHPVVRFTQAKKRMEDDGEDIECTECYETIEIEDGYYTCPEECDYQLCKECGECTDGGHQLTVQYGRPSTYPGLNVQCTKCNGYLGPQKIQFGFLHCLPCKFNLCVNCQGDERYFIKKD